MLDAWREVAPEHTPSLFELQATQGTFAHEGGYGRGWVEARVQDRIDALGVQLDGRGPGSNNWGAVSAYLPKGQPCRPGTFMWADTDANGHPYAVCMVAYESPAKGAAGALREVWRRPKVRAALATGSLRAYADAMRETTYTVTPGDKYAARILPMMKEIAAALGEPLTGQPDTPQPKPPTPKPPTPTPPRPTTTQPAQLADTAGNAGGLALAIAATLAIAMKRRKPRR